MSEPAPTRDALLARAAACYGRAGLRADALRCLEAAGDWAGAALLYQQAGNWSRAAACFERAECWRDAARCHGRAGRWLDAVRCLRAAGEQLEGAWTLAHLAQRPDQAAAGLAGVTPADADEALALRLVRARCLLRRDPVAAIELLRGVIAAVGDWSGDRPPTPARRRVLGWAWVLIDDLLDRPDLGAELHAACWRAGLPDAASAWETWAHERLGSAEGLPITQPPDSQPDPSPDQPTEPPTEPSIAADAEPAPAGPASDTGDRSHG